MPNNNSITPGRDSYVPVTGVHPSDNPRETTTLETETQITTVSYDPENNTDPEITHDVDRRITPRGLNGLSPSLD